jgi:hypothetical protein
MKFMRKAPSKEKGGRSRLGFYEIWQARRDSTCFRARKKSRPAAGVLPAQPLVSILRISPHSSATVVAVLARGGKPLLVQIQNGPAPRRHPQLEGEGVLIRPARRFRFLSDYFLAYAFLTN